MQPITSEDIQNCAHDCNGNPVVANQEGMTTGINFRGQPTTDTTSIQCVARQTIYSDLTKNVYELALNDRGGLLDPLEPTSRRSGWIKCNVEQFDMYVNICRTGIRFELNKIRDQLRVN